MSDVSEPPEHAIAAHEVPVWSARADFVIRSAIEDAQRHRGYTHEQLPARQVGDLRFEVCCIPFYLYDISLGDVVETDLEYDVIKVVRRGGRWTFRIYFEVHDVAVHERVHGELSSLGALTEWRSTHLGAVDAADMEMAQLVGDYLLTQEAAGTLVYETGRQSFA